MLMPDQRRRNVINFKVNSSAGMFYLHSVDGTGDDK